MRTRSIEELHGLGKVSARLLAQVEIRNEADLRALGAVEAFARVRLAVAPRASLNLLYALEAAILDIDWRSLSSEQKRSLRDQIGR